MIFLNNCYPFELQPLPYPYDALEPYIDKQTVEIHHNGHLKTYVDNLNKILQDYPQYQNLCLEELIMCSCILPEKIRTDVLNNAGGVYNHNLYFNIMGNSNNTPSEKMLKIINSCFGSFEQFKILFKESALNRFGSGYAVLAADKCGNLKIISTANQDTLLKTYLKPILLIDVWEHAYYLKYKNKRANYIDNWFNVIDWKNVEENYLKKDII